MTFDFDNSFSPQYDELENRYESIMETCFSFLKIKKNYEVDLSLVNAERIQQINRDYRNIDRVTDVISFAFEDDSSDLGRIKGDDVPIMLGEIFICIPRAIEQAKEIGNSLDRELRFLFIHGLLHLLGYDHMKKEDEETMFPLQEKILEMEEEQWKQKN